MQGDDVELTKDELTKLVKLCFDNTTSEDVKKIVIPEITNNYRKNGDGICRSLNCDPDKVCMHAFMF